jgi:hypothetical protein
MLRAAAARRFEPVAASAAMKARCFSGLQPSTRFLRDGSEVEEVLEVGEIALAGNAGGATAVADDWNDRNGRAGRGRTIIPQWFFSVVHPTG